VRLQQFLDFRLAHGQHRPAAVLAAEQEDPEAADREQRRQVQPVRVQAAAVQRAVVAGPRPCDPTTSSVWSSSSRQNDVSSAPTDSAAWRMTMSEISRALPAPLSAAVTCCRRASRCATSSASARATRSAS
jgi:hypothetical protein